MANQTVQDLLPFDDIESSMICLPGGEYRMAVEVGSVNYYLKTSSEQEMIEAIFRRGISSWDFPYMFYVQTREIDNSIVVDRLKQDIERNAVQFPNLATYGQKYLEDMKALGTTPGRNLTKKQYIIISCNDANKIKTNITEEDRRDYAFNKLKLSYSKVKDALSALNLNVHCLNSNELAEMLYCAINKTEGGKSKNIGSFITYMVNGDSKSLDKLQNDKLAVLFESFENQLKQEVFSGKDLSTNDLMKAQKLLDGVSIMRKDILEKDDTNDDSLFVL